MTARRILILSLVINLLLGTLLLGVNHRRFDQLSPKAKTSISINRALSRTMSPAPLQTNVVTVTAPFHWSQVESSDYRVYIANLRAIGCPERTIRDIIEADVNEIYFARVREIVDSVTGRFWDFIVDKETFEEVAKEKLEVLEKISDERKQLLSSLLDSPRAIEERNAEKKAEAQALLQKTYAFLPAEKIAAVQQIIQSSEEEESRITLQNPTGAAKAEKDFKAKREKAIEALLTPEEYTEYRLRNNDAADLRHRFANMNISKSEIRELVLANVESKGTDSIKRLLGPERYAEYQRAQDPAYDLMTRMTERFHLPDETTTRVYEMRREAEAQARRIREDKTRDPEERTALLQAIASETERSLSETLGPKIFKVYQQNDGNWYSHLADEAK